MKKMVCEICGSNTIRKENGFFVCLECGTQYSLEEAKSLLKEVGDSVSTSSSSTTTPKVDNSQKAYLINALHAWYEYEVAIDNFYQLMHLYFDNFIYTPNGLMPLENVERMNIKYKRGPLPEHFVNISHRESYMPYTYYDYTTGSTKSDTFAHDLYLCFGSFTRSKGTQDKLKAIFDRQKSFIDKLFPALPNHYTDTDIKNNGPYRICVLMNKDGKELFNFYKATDYAFIGHCNAFGYPFDELAIVIKELSVKDEPVVTRGFFGNKTTYVSKRVTNQYIAPFSKELLDAIKPLHDFASKMTNFLHKEYDLVDGYSKTMKDAYKSLLSMRASYSKLLDLPEDYQNVASIASLLEIVHFDKANSFDDALYVFMKDKIKAMSIKGLSSANKVIGVVDAASIKGNPTEVTSLINKTAGYIKSFEGLINKLESLDDMKEYDIKPYGPEFLKEKFK